MENIVVVIPAYNPNNRFNSLIEDVIQQIPNIIIIDDGSEVPISIDCLGAVVLKNQTNYGKGFSLMRGFKYAIENNYTSAITIDSDGQHDPSCIQEFIQLDQSIDIVSGNRNFSDGMPFHRRISNFITSFILSLRCGKIISDSQCGYRRYKLKSISKYDFNEKGFHFESEVLMKILCNGGTFAQINIPTIYNDEGSHIKHLSDTLQFISLIVRSIFW